MQVNLLRLISGTPPNVMPRFPKVTLGHDQLEVLEGRVPELSVCIRIWPIIWRWVVTLLALGLSSN
jgi:hypothetical protein